MDVVPLNLERDGVLLCAGAAAECLPDLCNFANTLPNDEAGVRVYDVGQVRSHLIGSGGIGRLVRDQMGSDARPVRAILFDKSAKTNWHLAWHQDRMIHVKERHVVRGFHSWTVKRGRIHVEPPIALLESMLTVRLHLDDVPLQNAPLLIIPGSHRCGLIPHDEIDQLAGRVPVIACVAAAGDVWLYSTPIVHGSRRAENPRRRRVLQIDYAARDLPPPLEWAGL